MEDQAGQEEVAVEGPTPRRVIHEVWIAVDCTIKILVTPTGYAVAARKVGKARKRSRRRASV